MWILENCDIYRDGGSYGATLSFNGEEWTLWLQVQWEKETPGEMRYESLWIGKGFNPEPKGVELRNGSPEEAHWLRILREAAPNSESLSAEALRRRDEFIRAATDRRMTWGRK